MNIKETVDFVKRSIIAVTPWSNNYVGSDEYRQGWNDCVKEMRKRRIKFVNKLEKIREAK